MSRSLRDHLERNATRIGLALEKEALAAARRDFRQAEEASPGITYDVGEWTVGIRLPLLTIRKAKLLSYIRVLRTLAGTEGDENEHHTYARIVWEQMKASRPELVEEAVQQERYLNHPVYVMAVLRMYGERSR